VDVNVDVNAVKIQSYESKSLLKLKKKLGRVLCAFLNAPGVKKLLHGIGLLSYLSKSYN